MDMGTANSQFISGMIILWSGSIVSIPVGWFLCNGSNGTPDLRNKFIVGAGSAYDPEDTGGGLNHAHGIDINHSHGIGPGALIDLPSAPDTAITSTIATVYTDSQNHLPPYFALAYIMKS